VGILSHLHHILCPNITLKQQTKHLPQIILYPRRINIWKNETLCVRMTILS